MSDRPWTAGPWKVHLVDETLVTSKNADIATTFFGSAANAEERASNARLIAGAPELYEALEKALNYIENTESEFGITLPCGDVARAVLRKARGEE